MYNFNNFHIEKKKTNYGKQMILKNIAIEMEKCRENFNREDSWKIGDTYSNN